MFLRLMASVLGVLAGLGLLATSSGLAGEKKEEAKGMRVEGKLTSDDPLDKKMAKSHHKVHEFELKSGKTYRIDLTSKEFDTFLRLEDADGKELEFNDDIDPRNLNSRVVHKAAKDGKYRVIVTTYDPGKVGAYQVAITEPTAQDILESRVKNLRKSSPEEQKEIIAEYLKELAGRKDKLTIQDVQLAALAAQSVEGGSPARAAEVFTEVGKVLSEAGDKKIADFGKTFLGAGRRMKLPGSEMALKGTGVDGKEVDLKKYRGKVVLVDFWATWCGPCLQELPNVKKLYETYNGKGFDVIGISLDFNKEALDKFLEKDKLPWVNLYDKNAGDNQLSQYYGIFSIPLAILVDREGRVVSMNARGPELERLLEKHLGGSKEEKKDKTP